MGTPCSGPRQSPRSASASAASASWRARSAQTVTTAFSAGFTRSTRARHASTSSRDDARRSRSALASATADAEQASRSATGDEAPLLERAEREVSVEAAEALAAAARGAERARAGRAPDLLPEAAVLEELVVRPAARVVLGAVDLDEGHAPGGAVAAHPVAMGVPDQHPLHLRVRADQVEEAQRVLGEHTDR